MFSDECKPAGIAACPPLFYKYSGSLATSIIFYVKHFRFLFYENAANPEIADSFKGKHTPSTHADFTSTAVPTLRKCSPTHLPWTNLCCHYFCGPFLQQVNTLTPQPPNIILNIRI